MVFTACDLGDIIPTTRPWKQNFDFKLNGKGRAVLWI